MTSLEHYGGSFEPYELNVSKLIPVDQEQNAGRCFVTVESVGEGKLKLTSVSETLGMTYSALEFLVCKKTTRSKNYLNEAEVRW